MQILITLLTLILVVISLFLILLVLIQLPKKEAGAGLAFGAGATDALFGAGSGNALTKLTKYMGGGFLILALIIGILNSNEAHKSGSNVMKGLAARKSTATPPPVTTPANQFQQLSSTNLLTLTSTNAASTNPAPATNAGVVHAVTNAAPAATTNAPK